MNATTWSQTERANLAAALTEAGPDAPTLCGDWTTRDLAAHLVLRESRPEAAAGIVIGFLNKLTERVQDSYATRDYDELVSSFADGPPRLSVFSLPGMDERLNTFEHFVHLEDVRRAQPDWRPRELDQAYRDVLWSQLRKQARMYFRNVRVGASMLRTDAPSQDHHQVSKGLPNVLISGTAPELVMFSFGRKEHAEVELLGPPAAVDAVMSADMAV